jgi:hypothetical protein
LITTGAGINHSSSNHRHMPMPWNITRIALTQSMSGSQRSECVCGINVGGAPLAMSSAMSAMSLNGDSEWVRFSFIYSLPCRNSHNKPRLLMLLILLPSLGLGLIHLLILLGFFEFVHGEGDDSSYEDSSNAECTCFVWWLFFCACRVTYFLLGKYTVLGSVAISKLGKYLISILITVDSKCFSPFPVSYYKFINIPNSVFKRSLSTALSGIYTCSCKFQTVRPSFSTTSQKMAIWVYKFIPRTLKFLLFVMASESGNKFRTKVQLEGQIGYSCQMDPGTPDLAAAQA